MARRKHKSLGQWSMFPSKHDEVAEILETEGLTFRFNNEDKEDGYIRDWDTSIMGRFKCNNKRCTTDGWSSKKIAIWIRMYDHERYNARVFHQHCLGCYSMAKPILDESYAQRVAYRLMKWSGVQLESPGHSGASKGPHEKRHCEGCKAGHCKAGSLFDD
ncbi:zinc-binding domain-containing protein [Xylaria nigripes]|nr:zinc-binding domain-containing protein [Xylaria nigripes]